MPADPEISRPSRSSSRKKPHNPNHWDGVPPERWTRQRKENLAAYRRHKVAKVRGELPEVHACMLRERFVELFRAGTLYPYPLTQRRRTRCVRPMPTLPERGWRKAVELRDVHIRALAVIVTGHLVCKTAGVMVTHAEMGELIGLKARRTGDVMRELVAFGFLESVPWFTREEGATRSLRCASLYRVTKAAIAHFDIRPVRAGMRLARTAKQEDLVLRTNPEIVESPTGDGLPQVPTDAIDVDAERVKPRPDALPGSGGGEVRRVARLDVVRLAAREIAAQTEALLKERNVLAQAKLALDEERRRLADVERRVERATERLARDAERVPVPYPTPAPAAPAPNETHEQRRRRLLDELACEKAKRGVDRNDQRIGDILEELAELRRLA